MFLTFSLFLDAHGLFQLLHLVNCRVGRDQCHVLLIDAQHLLQLAAPVSPVLRSYLAAVSAHRKLRVYVHETAYG